MLDGPLVEDPVRDDERHAVAGQCVADLGLDMIPAVIDRIDDHANRAYAAWPDRLYLVGTDGKIAYAGGRGPFGFAPDELEAALEQELAKAPAVGPAVEPAVEPESPPAPPRRK